MTDAEFQPHTQGDLRAAPPVRPFTWPLLVQAVSYALLVGLACLSGSGAPTSFSFSFTAFAVAVMIMLFAFFTPLRDGVPGRVVALVLGFVAMVFASTPFLGELVFSGDDRWTPRDMDSPYLNAAAWFAGVAGLLVALVVAAFIRQMARARRTDMIVRMSHMVADGVASICASGWCFLPLLIHEAVESDVWRLLCLVAVVAGVVALALVSRLWYRDARPLDGAPAPWIGFGLMPVMLSGALVGVAALVMLLV